MISVKVFVILLTYMLKDYKNNSTLKVILLGSSVGCVIRNKKFGKISETRIIKRM